MYFFLSFSLKVLALSTYGDECYEFSCNTNMISDIETESVTVDHENKTIIIRGCQILLNLTCDYLLNYSEPEKNWKSQKCSYTNQASTTQDCLAVATKLTGENCCVDTNCVSGDCIDGTCRGKSLNSDCKKSSECAVDTYCSSNSACVRVADYTDPCFSDDECPTGGGCNNGICTKIFSQPAGTMVDDPKFCASNFELSGYCDILTVKLQNSNFTLNRPFMCQEGDICEFYTYNGSYFDGFECKCAGLKGLPEGFCGEHLVNVKGVMDVVWTAIQYSSSQCSGQKAHTSNALDLIKCGSITVEQYLFYFNIYRQAYYWNIYVTGSLDACAQTLLLWNPFYTYRDFNSGLFHIFSSSLLLFLAF